MVLSPSAFIAYSANKETTHAVVYSMISAIMLSARCNRSDGHRVNGAVGVCLEQRLEGGARP